MRKLTIYEKFKQYLSGLGFKLFLWGGNLTAEQYWKMIQEQENAYDQRHNQTFDF